MRASWRLQSTARLCQICRGWRTAYLGQLGGKAQPPAAAGRRNGNGPPTQQRRFHSTGAEARSDHDSVYDDLTSTQTLAQSASSTELPKTDREEAIAKARVVFGSRLAGPIERQRELDAASTRVAGVVVPPRPEEPDNCCMSGCVNCVWDRYRDEMEEWAAASAKARTRLQAQRQREREERAATRGIDTASTQPAAMPSHIASSMDDDGGGSETNWPAPQESQDSDLFDAIPVGIREFMRTEKRLRDKKKKR